MILISGVNGSNRKNICVACSKKRVDKSYNDKRISSSMYNCNLNVSDPIPSFHSSIPIIVGRGGSISK